MQEQTNRRKRATAVLAVAAGAALLIGGSTYALWSQTANMNGGMITSGDLQLLAGDVSSFDVSADRVDSSTTEEKDRSVLDAALNPLTFNQGEASAVENLNCGEDEVTLTGHVIGEPGEWLIVPGDTTAVLFPYAVTLKGDNLVAELTIDTTGLVKDNVHMAYYYAVFDAEGKQIGSTHQLGSDPALSVALFQANQAGQGAGVPDKYTESGEVIPIIDINDENDQTGVITLVVFGHFDKATPDREMANTTDDLRGLTATLIQVREGTDNFIDQ